MDKRFLSQELTEAGRHQGSGHFLQLKYFGWRHFNDLAQEVLERNRVLGSADDNAGVFISRIEGQIPSFIVERDPRVGVEDGIIQRILSEFFSNLR